MRGELGRSREHSQGGRGWRGVGVGLGGKEGGPER